MDIFSINGGSKSKGQVFERAATLEEGVSWGEEEVPGASKEAEHNLATASAARDAGEDLVSDPDAPGERQNKDKPEEADEASPSAQEDEDTYAKIQELELEYALLLAETEGLTQKIRQKAGSKLPSVSSRFRKTKSSSKKSASSSSADRRRTTLGSNHPQGLIKRTNHWS